MKCLKKIKKILRKEEKKLDEIEIISAPSGEWAEYNLEYLQQQSILEGIVSVIEILESEK